MLKYFRGVSTNHSPLRAAAANGRERAGLMGWWAWPPPAPRPAPAGRARGCYGRLCVPCVVSMSGFQVLVRVCVPCPYPGSVSHVRVRVPDPGPCPCLGRALQPCALPAPGAGPGPGRAVPVPGNPRVSSARCVRPWPGPRTERGSDCSRGHGGTQSRHCLRSQAQSSEPRDAQWSQLLALLWAQPWSAPPQSWGGSC